MGYMAVIPMLILLARLAFLALRLTCKATKTAVVGTVKLAGAIADAYDECHAEPPAQKAPVVVSGASQERPFDEREFEERVKREFLEHAVFMELKSRGMGDAEARALMSKYAN